MKGVVALTASILVALTANAVEAVSLWEYRYDGPELLLTNPVPGFPTNLAGYKFEFVVDEREVPGDTLKNVRLDFTRAFSEGVVSFRSFGGPVINIPPETDEGNWQFLLSTDEQRQVKNEPFFPTGLIHTEQINGIPLKYGMVGFDFTDSYGVLDPVLGSAVWDSFGETGTWTVAPIPLPSTLALLVPGLLTLGVAARRSRHRSNVVI